MEVVDSRRHLEVYIYIIIWPDRYIECIGKKVYFSSTSYFLEQFLRVEQAIIVPPLKEWSLGYVLIQKY